MDDKRMLRAGVLRRREARTAAERDAAGPLIAAHGLVLARACRVVAAHAAVGTEPPTRPLLEALVAAGTRVLLPIVDGSALTWGDLREWSALVPSPLGLLQPLPSDDADAVAAAADLLLVPALAVDRAGHRLGRGGGYFDRWLATHSPARIVAVVYDDEVVAHVPYEPHDQPVAAALTPAGVVALGQ